jgi:hypothetical protein
MTDFSVGCVVCGSFYHDGCCRWFAFVLVDEPLACDFRFSTS